MVLDKPLDSTGSDGTLGGPLQHSAIGDGSIRTGLKSVPRFKPSIEILCSNQASGIISSVSTHPFYHCYVSDAVVR